MKIDFEEQLFNVVSKIKNVEGTDFDIHKLTEFTDDDTIYRVYHKKGYCFNIAKEPEYDDQTGEITGWYYEFSAHWEGFDNTLTPELAIKLLTK